jgi:hypothetical protein
MGGVSIALFLGGSQVLGVVPKALAKGDIIEKNNWRGTIGLHNV